MFEYLFYRIYWWNKVVVKEKDLLVFSSWLGISVFKILNLTTLIFVILIWKGIISDYQKWMQVTLMVSVLLYDYFFYIKNSNYKNIIRKFSNTNKIITKDALLIVYILLTFVLFFAVVITGAKLQNKEFSFYKNQEPLNYSVYDIKKG